MSSTACCNYLFLEVIYIFISNIETHTHIYKDRRDRDPLCGASLLNDCKGKGCVGISQKPRI